MQRLLVVSFGVITKANWPVYYQAILTAYRRHKPLG